MMNSNENADIVLRENAELRRKNRLLEDRIKRADARIAELEAAAGTLQCPECEKPFQSKSALSKHAKTHEQASSKAD